LLEHVSSLGIPTAVATSTRTERAREKLLRAGVLDRFHEVVGGDQVAHSKPSPDIYLRVAELLRVRPRGCLALEDSDNGVRAALAAGMTVVQIPDLLSPSADVLELGHIVLTSLAEVAEYPFSAE
jgi:beta-phosphoglucomutase-like phosphatase (HAD superfamily)